MPIQERVTKYTVAQIRNDIVNYRHVIRLTTETGHEVFVAFPPSPPANWLTISGTNTNAFLEESEFDRMHHLLQTESPLFFTSLSLLGLRAFNLSTGSELPGEGPADDDALVEFMTQVRREFANAT